MIAPRRQAAPKPIFQAAPRERRKNRPIKGKRKRRERKDKTERKAKKEPSRRKKKPKSRRIGKAAVDVGGFVYSSFDLLLKFQIPVIIIFQEIVVHFV